MIASVQYQQFLTRIEAAKRLGISEPTMRRLVKEGRIPTVTLPGMKRGRIHVADLEAYARGDRGRESGNAA